jgi:phage gpG-like protein
MATGVNIEFSKKAQEILEAPNGLTPRVQNAIQRAMNAAMEEVAGRISEKRLSFSSSQKPTLDGLRVITNRLRSSMMRGGPGNASKAAAWDGLACVGSIGTNVKYAAIHEFGGRIQRKASARRINFVEGKFASKKRFLEAVKGKKFWEDHRRVIAYGRAYTINMPARAPVTKTVNENRAFFAAAVSHAIEEASK